MTADQLEQKYWPGWSSKVVHIASAAVSFAGRFDRPEDGKPKVPDGTVIERPVMDDTPPGGPVRRTIQYAAPFSLADREQDY